MQSRRQFVVLSLAATACASAADRSWAQDYPVRVITIIVPAAAGGAGDPFGRIISARVKSALGQPAILENVAGASGTIGAARVAHAAPDGYTLILGNSASHVLKPAAGTTSYDALTDFEPIALVARNPLVMVGRKTLPANSLMDLVAWLRTNPGRATAGTAGPGSLPHLAGLLFQSKTGTDFDFIPYRGESIAVQDLAAGHIDLMFGFAVTCAPLIHAGLIKGFAVPGSSRLKALAEVPTMDEAGLSGLHVAAFNALWAPRGTPSDIIGKLNKVVVDAFAAPDVRVQLADIGQEIPPRDQQTPEALRAFQLAEIQQWSSIIKAAGLKLE